MVFWRVCFAFSDTCTWCGAGFFDNPRRVSALNTSQGCFFPGREAHLCTAYLGLSRGTYFKSVVSTYPRNHITGNGGNEKLSSFATQDGWQVGTSVWNPTTWNVLVNLYFVRCFNTSCDVLILCVNFYFVRREGNQGTYV